MDANTRMKLEGCRRFKKYGSIDEYVEDLVFCLMNSSWQYSEERAREIVRERYDYVQEAFSDKETAWSCTAEIGYHCG